MPRWRRHLGSALWSLAPLALAVCVMLPRLASPQFGLLDDGFTLEAGRALIGRWSSALHLIPETGRFFPAYWLTRGALVALLGRSPLGFFAVNTLLLAGLLALLAGLVALAGGTRRHAAIAAVLFASSGPAVEAFYTLSKPEPMQLSWIAVSVLATAASIVRRTAVGRVALTAAAAAALLLANATKETGIALVPISAGWLMIERWWLRDRGAGLAFARRYAFLTLVAAVAFGALRWHFAPLALADGWYTRAYSADPRILGAAALRLGVWLVRDFAYLLPVIALAIASLFGGAIAHRRAAAYTGLWMAGWLAVYVPWPVAFEYYLLPFTLGAAVLGGLVLGDSAARLSRWRRDATASIGIAVLLLATAALWAATIVNAVGDARVQLAVDRANAELVDVLAALPPRSRVAINTPWLDEYVVELPRHLAELKRRSDVTVGHVSRVDRDVDVSAPIFIATPDLADPLVPTVRIPFDEAGVRSVNARLDATLDGRGELVHRTGQRAMILEIGLHRALCRFARSAPAARPYCASGRPVIAAHTFAYGWQVHRVRQDVRARRRVRVSDRDPS